MSNITLTVDHALGRSEAMKRIRAAAEAQQAKVSGFVKEATWTEDLVSVVGLGFSGQIRVAEREVTVDAELGFPASLMPLKIQKEAEAWLRGVLGT